MRRMVARIDPTVEVIALDGDIFCAANARLVAAADFVFSATDTMLARYAVNAIAHQYLVPAAQVGAKVVADRRHRREPSLVYSMYRPIDFSAACLECCGAIDPERLRREQLGERERRDQAYVDGVHVDLPDPSMLALNAVGTALALLDFQLSATGLHRPSTTLDHRVYHALDRELRARSEPSRPGCRWCDRSAGQGVMARGDDVALPLREGRPTRPRSRFPRLRHAGRHKPIRTPTAGAHAQRGDVPVDLRAALGRSTRRGLIEVDGRSPCGSQRGPLPRRGSSPSRRCERRLFSSARASTGSDRTMRSPRTRRLRFR